MTKGLLWWQRGVLILVSGAVAIGFFALLRLMVQPRSVTRRAPGTPRGGRTP